MEKEVKKEYVVIEKEIKKEYGAVKKQSMQHASRQKQHVENLVQTPLCRNVGSECVRPPQLRAERRRPFIPS